MHDYSPQELQRLWKKHGQDLKNVTPEDKAWIISLSTKKGRMDGIKDIMSRQRAPNAPLRSPHRGSSTQMKRAVWYGRLDWLQRLYELDADWNQDIPALAAARGNLTILEFLYEHGCPWDEWTCIYASKYGHLDCLRYAYEHGCRFDKRACEKAGTIECLEYARSKGMCTVEPAPYRQIGVYTVPNNDPRADEP